MGRTNLKFCFGGISPKSLFSNCIRNAALQETTTSHSWPCFSKTVKGFAHESLPARRQSRTGTPGDMDSLGFPAYKIRASESNTASQEIDECLTPLAAMVLLTRALLVSLSMVLLTRRNLVGTFVGHCSNAEKLW